MFGRNSLLARVFESLSISNSIASVGDSGFSTLRSAQILDIVVAEQAAGLAQDDRQFEFQNVPNYTVVDFGVAVDENVAEGDDPPIFADLRGHGGIGPG